MPKIMDILASLLTTKVDARTDVVWGEDYHHKPEVGGHILCVASLLISVHVTLALMMGQSPLSLGMAYVASGLPQFGFL